MSIKGVAVVLAIGLFSGGIAYATTLRSENPRVAVEFYKGHWHDEHGTHGAPGHSGGTDAFGCHNGSVPYHCH